MDGAEASDHRISIWPLGIHSETLGTVPGKLIKLNEGSCIEEQFDSFSRSLLALGVLLLNRGLTCSVNGFVVALS